MAFYAMDELADRNKLIDWTKALAVLIGQTEKNGIVHYMV